MYCDFAASRKIRSAAAPATSAAAPEPDEVTAAALERNGATAASATSFSEGLAKAKGKNVYIAGGYGLYKEAIPFVDVMYITEIDIDIEGGDVFFPEFDSNDFDVTVGETLGDDIRFTRTIYRRKR